MKFFVNNTEDRWVKPWENDEARVLCGYLTETERDKLRAKARVFKKGVAHSEESMQRRYEVLYLCEALREWEGFSDEKGTALPCDEATIERLYNIYPSTMRSLFTQMSSEFLLGEEDATEKNSVAGSAAKSAKKQPEAA